MRLHSRSRGPWLPGNPTFCPPSPQKAISWSPPEAQRVKDPVLAWLWLRLQLWRRSVLPSPSSASALALLCPAMYTRVQMPWVTVPLGPPRSLPAVPSVPCSLPAHLQQRPSLMLFLPAEKCSFNLTLRPATAHLFISVPGKRAQKPCLRC